MPLPKDLPDDTEGHKARLNVPTETRSSTEVRPAHAAMVPLLHAPSGVADDDVDELAATGVDHLVRSAARQDRARPSGWRARVARARPGWYPAGTTTRSRSLPLTWIGTSRVLRRATTSSNSGQRSAWIDDHSRRSAASRRAPQLLGDVRRGRRQHQQQQPDRLVPLGRARRRPCRGSASAGSPAPSGGRPSC